MIGWLAGWAGSFFFSALLVVGWLVGWAGSFFFLPALLTVGWSRIQISGDGNVFINDGTIYDNKVYVNLISNGGIYTLNFGKRMSLRPIFW